MTEQEAIECLEDCINNQPCECKNEMLLAIKALEKQIPKNIDIRNSIHHYCPSCNLYFDSRDWKSKYCGRCGQAIKW